jgi:uncharacterized membrane protein YpjA
MLWHKGWLETRFRLLLGLAFMGVLLASFYSDRSKPLPPGAGSIGFLLVSVSCVGLIAGLLAGAGIATQPGVRAAKGLHGSMFFTLALPVSRFRLLAVRAGLGWLEMTAAIGLFCLGMWTVSPVLQSTATAAEMLEHAAVLIVFASALYCMSVLLATFLDDQARMLGTMILFGALWGLSNRLPLPASANIFEAMGSASPLIAHAIPWPAISICLASAAALLAAALKVVQTRDY